MKKMIAILACKLVKTVLKPFGRGSSMPGKIALKICPDVLSRVKMPEIVAAVTGSNGKTSTVEMIAYVMSQAGKKVIWNREGSNQIAGVASIVLANCTVSGKVKGDVLLLESDERYAKYSFSYFVPTHYVITNLYRDQLTRNGHPEWVYESIKESIKDGSMLILNADDPLVSLYGRGRENTVYFGMDKQPFSTDRNTGVYDDGKYCPECKAKMKYDFYHFNHIGSFYCEGCGHKKQETSYSVTNADLENGMITVNGKYDIKLAFKSVYNVYNILACFALCSIAGINEAFIAENLSNYILKNGRVLQFRLGVNQGTFLISKHENSVSYDRSLDAIVSSGDTCAVIVIVDSVSRRYSTGETSWLWDIDFNVLSSDNVKHIYLLGKHCSDLEQRISFTDVDKEKITASPDIEDSLDEIGKIPYDKLYTVTCFSDKEKFLSKVTVIDREGDNV